MSGTKPRDDNDMLRDGDLPGDPTEDAKVVAAEAPRVLTVRDLLRGSRIEADRKNVKSAVTTGNYRLDAITGGMIPGFVWVMGADTSWGKSSFLVMLVDENLKRKKRVMIVSSEDSEKLYGDRLMLRRTRNSANRLRGKKITAEERDKMLTAEQSAEDSPVFLDARGRGVEWVARHVKAIIREQEIDMVAYDYLQAFDNEKPQQDRRNQITYIARTLTDITKSLDRTGIIFSQITVEKGKPIPDKHSIRESRDVSNAAEVVLLGFIPEKDVMAASREAGRPPEKVVGVGERALLVDKCKNGPKGAMLRMPWDDESACFDTLEDPETERLRKLAEQAGADEFQTDELDWRDN
jgi:replicative DNA helicase